MSYQSSPVSIPKIIFILSLCFILLMFSVLAYHAYHSNDSKKLYTSGNVTLFPSSRTIKPFELASSKNESFKNKNLLNHWTLMFFGFTHCSSICPENLTLLNKVYQALSKTYPELQVVLVSLDPDRDNTNRLRAYTQSFNPNFIGVTGKLASIRQLQSQFGIISARDEMSSSSNYQLQHTASILLINPKAQWAGLFRYGLNPKELILEFKNSVTSLSAL